MCVQNRLTINDKSAVMKEDCSLFINSWRTKPFGAAVLKGRKGGYKIMDLKNIIDDMNYLFM